MTKIRNPAAEGAAAVKRDDAQRELVAMLRRLVNAPNEHRLALALEDAERLLIEKYGGKS
jgi:hypothetical protein